MRFYDRTKKFRLWPNCRCNASITSRLPRPRHLLLPRVAVEYLETAAKLGRHLLYRKCITYIQGSFDKVSVSRSFSSISEKSFDAIVRDHIVPPLS